ncbi:hypothetical protein KPL70_023379 [Citrus sinensis]|nr:hypothetical protein KPL70_023379 [Citrus sinensis]
MLLRRLAVLSSSPWLCCGDFNEILHPDEKRGGNDRNVNLINEFKEALRDCGLKDVGYRGYDFTWNNGRYGKGFMEERLDRFVCSKAWSDRFVDCEASNLDTWTSDHCPVLMAIQEKREGMNQRGRHSSRIHYEDMWSSYDVCKEIIKEEWSLHRNWSSEDTAQSFRQATKASMGRLLGWSKLEFRKRDRKLEKLKNQLRLVFSRASMTDCQNLKRILESCSTASGQIFNFKKSSLFLSGNVQQDQAEAIGNLFQLNIVSRHEKYLGLPSMIGRKKSSFFNDIKLTVSNKISSWQHKFFSCEGKEVLIKAVVQAIPAYAMSVFKIPMGVCDDIKKMVAKFWWGSKREERNIHWAKWENMSQAKCLGGMGFHDFSSFNRALLAKQGWRIRQCPDSLVARVLQAKYFQSKNFLDAKLGSNPSYIWRSLLWGRKIICSGSRWRVGNGQKIHVHKANWIPQPSTFQPVVKPSLLPDAMVSDLINEANYWDEKRIYEHFDKIDADLITKIPLPRRPREDELIWHYGKNGQFSEPTCQVCKMGMENVFHALVACKSAEKVWKLIHFDDDIHVAHSQDILSLLHAMKRMRMRDDLELLVTIFWVKWNARNQLIFKGKRETPQIMVAKAEAMIAAYKKVHSPAEACSETEQRVPPQTWNPPQDGFVKVNIDAAISFEKNIVGLGAVIKDVLRHVTAAAIKVSKFHEDVSYAEAEAIEWGIKYLPFFLWREMHK